MSSSKPSAPKRSIASERNSGTVATAARLEIAVIEIDSAVSPRARWVSRFAIVPPGRCAEQDEADGQRRLEVEELRDPERQQRRDDARG